MSLARCKTARADTQRIQSPDVMKSRWRSSCGNNAFAFDLYRAKGDGNMILSTASRWPSRWRTLERGETETQMAGTLNYLPQQTQHAAFNALEQRMSGLGERWR